MAAETNQITKIYELRTIGYDQTHSQFEQLYQDLLKIRKAKVDLSGVKTKIVDPVELSAANKELADLTTSEEKLIKQINGGTIAADKSASAYFKLIQQYKAAKTSAEDLAAEYGIESEQAIKASASAALLKNELAAINNLIKTGGQARVGPLSAVPAAPAPEIPFTTNLEALKAEQEALKQTGTVVNEFDLAQAEAAISAKEFGDSQKVVSEEVAASATSYNGIVGAFDQYSGKLRDNLIAQVENGNALAANKIQQKELADIIKAQGFATDEQVGKLAALKEEALILNQTNKELSVTIRNQVKEFVAASGSIDEMQAQLNQLQQAYTQLSEVEKGSPFGTELKAEIDLLEPKVKELEASLGQFSRNVGNYPTVFTGAFKVLENELDTVQGKLVQGNFAGKELDELAAKQATLSTVTQNLGKNYTSTAAQANAFKEAARQLGIVYGTDSEVFKNFTKEVGAGNIQLKETDKQLNVASGSGKKFGGVFQSIFSQLRNIANIIPGIGISGIVLLVLEPLTALASKIGDISFKSKEAKGSVEDLNRQFKESTRIIGETGNKFVEAAVTVNELKINLDLARQGFLDKDQVIKQYNDTIGKTTGQVKTLDEAEQALVKNGDAYIQMMLLKAAANVALEDAAKKAFEAEQTRRKREQDFANAAIDSRVTAGGATGFGAGTFNAAEFDRQEKAVSAARQKRREDQAKEQDKDKQNLIDIAAKFQKDAALIAKQYKADFFNGTEDPKTKKERVDRLSVAEQNEIKLIEATRLRLLAIENKNTNEIQKVRELSTQEEINHLTIIEKINVDALNAKSALLQRDKTLNAEQAKTLAEFGEQRSAIELQTSQKILAVQKKQFDDINKSLKAELDEQIRIAEAANKQIQDNPGVNNVDKALAQEQANQVILELQQKYLTRLQQLNDDFNRDAIAKAKEAADKAAAAASNARNQVSLSSLKDIKSEGARKIAAIEAQYADETKKILDSENRTVEKKKELVEKLARAAKRTILSAELETLNAEVEEEARLLSQNLISYDDYLQAVAAQKRKAAEVSAASPANDPTKSKNPLSRLLGFTAGSVEEKGANAVITASYSFAQDAMNGYFDAENERIQQSLKLTEERIESDRAAALSRAQSRAEEDSINRQYDQKKKQAQKDAFEQTKKIKRAEAEIAFATEIANIFSTAFELGPIAGPIVGAILAGLATARFGLTLNRINKAQAFEYGGEVPTKGGVFGGRSHKDGGTDFNYRGRTFNAEIDELAVIRTKNANPNQRLNISGTHAQIASALNRYGGGKDFRPGASLRKFEYGGSLGESLQAPVFVPSSIIATGSDNSKMYEALTEQTIEIRKQTKAINDRIDRIEVRQVTSTVTNAQKKIVKQTAVGTL